MNRTIFILLAAFVLFSGCTEQKTDQQLPDFSQRMAECGAKPSVDQQDTCYVVLAAESNDVSPCAMVSSKNTDNCYLAVGMTNGNASLCTHAPDKEVLYTCYAYIAADTHDPSLCNKIVNDSEMLESCFQLATGQNQS